MQGEETENPFAARISSGLGLMLIVLWAAVARWDAWSLPGRNAPRRLAVINSTVMDLAPHVRVPAPQRAPGRSAPPAERAPGGSAAFSATAGEAWPAGRLPWPER
jgi:hypothetical protein